MLLVEQALHVLAGSVRASGDEVEAAVLGQLVASAHLLRRALVPGDHFGIGHDGVFEPAVHEQLAAAREERGEVAGAGVERRRPGLFHGEQIRVGRVLDLGLAAQRLPPVEHPLVALRGHERRAEGNARVDVPSADDGAAEHVAEAGLLVGRAERGTPFRGASEHARLGFGRPAGVEDELSARERRRFVREPVERGLLGGGELLVGEEERAVVVVHLPPVPEEVDVQRQARVGGDPGEDAVVVLGIAFGLVDGLSAARGFSLEVAVADLASVVGLGHGFRGDGHEVGGPVAEVEDRVVRLHAARGTHVGVGGRVARLGDGREAAHVAGGAAVSEAAEASRPFVGGREHERAADEGAGARTQHVVHGGDAAVLVDLGLRDLAVRELERGDGRKGVPAGDDGLRRARGGQGQDDVQVFHGDIIPHFRAVVGRQKTGRVALPRDLQNTGWSRSRPSK